MPRKSFYRFRGWVQAATTLITNGYVAGFLKSTIFKGPTKQLCVPGLNCYSCPGALGACPIGSFQAVVGGSKRSFSYYVVGIVLFFGVIFGRVVCGFLCPFGWFQDLLHKIPTPKLTIPKKADRPLRFFKYLVLLIPVILLPVFLTNKYGTAPPYFCQWICPAGALEGGIPLVSTDKGLQNQIGFLFGWKMSLLISIVLLSVFLYRPFCKYLCPLGAFYSLFNKVALFQMAVLPSLCIHCGACTRNCKMGVDVLKDINSPECIRCGACQQHCPTGAIVSGFFLKKADGSTEKADRLQLPENE